MGLIHIDVPYILMYPIWGENLSLTLLKGSVSAWLLKTRPLLGLRENLVLLKQETFLAGEKVVWAKFAFCCLGSSMLQLLFRVAGKGMTSLSFHTYQVRLTCLLGPLLLVQLDLRS